MSDQRTELLGRLARDLHQVADAGGAPASPPPDAPVSSPASAADPAYDVPSAVQVQRGPVEKLFGRFKRG